MITPPPAAPANPDWAKLTANCIASLPAMPGYVQELYLAEDPGDIAAMISMRTIAEAIRARRAALPEWADMP